MSQEAWALASEIELLKSILADIPQDRVIDRLSFEARLAKAEAEVAALAPYQHKEKACLTFRGRPVFGTHGIAADFGSYATAAFSQAFAAVMASLDENLKGSGPIAGREKNQLVLTGVALGSFGFEFELPGHIDSMFPNSIKGSDAIEKIQALLETSSTGSDDDITELVDEIHPRAVKKVAEFLDLLGSHDATCALSFKDHAFQYTHPSQVKSSLDRLREDNIREEVLHVLGHFEGVLPHSRRFEFWSKESRTIIKGRLDISADDAEELNRQWLKKEATVALKSLRVGSGNPKYTFHDINLLHAAT